MNLNTKIVDIIFLLSILMLFTLSSSYCQQQYLNTEVTVKADSIALDVILDNLAKQCNCYFTYNATLINGSKKVSTSIIKLPLNRALDSIIAIPNLLLSEYKNQVVIAIDTLTQVRKHIINKPLTVSINGKVINKSDQQPLAFATVALQRSFMGTICNNTGDFGLEIPLQQSSDSLIISYVGFYSIILPINYFIEHQIVELEPGLVSIQEIVVRSSDPGIIIKKARENIDNNYQTMPFGFQAFYREWVKKETKCLQYTEALLQGFKPKMHSFYSTDKVQLMQSRSFSNIKNSDTVLVKIRGGIESCFSIDVVDELPIFIQYDGKNLYDYKLADILIWENTLVYAIKFTTKAYIKESLLEGTLYIAVEDYAIVGSEFEYNERKLNMKQNTFVLKKSKTVRVKPILTNYTVQYKKWNNKYYLSHVRGELEMIIKNRNKLFKKKYTTLIEMAITEIDTNSTQKEIAKNTTIKTNTIFSDSEFIYQQKYWQGNSFIKPEDDILNALKQSGLKLNEVKNTIN